MLMIPFSSKTEVLANCLSLSFERQASDVITVFQQIPFFFFECFPFILMGSRM